MSPVSGAKQQKRPPALVQYADLILPYLPPRDLASAALTCKTLRLYSSAVTRRRCSDATRGLEKRPVPFAEEQSYSYSYFLYTPTPILPCHPSSSAPFSQPWGGATTDSSPVRPGIPHNYELRTASGCDCEGICAVGECPCSMWRPGTSSEVATECGLGCRCGEECGNRVTLEGIGVGLRIVRGDRKGWGLHADEHIAKGRFICEYAGEYLTTGEATKRLKIYDALAANKKLGPALLVVREHLPSGKACLRYNIDATNVGNIARFINHSCDGGNLSSVLVRNSGSVLPRLCFFAARDITDGEELTFSYGDVCSKSGGIACFCGSWGCKGVLPSEEA